MKVKLLFIGIMFFMGIVLLHGQTVVGKVSFFAGEIQVTVEGSNSWEKVKMNTKIASNHILKLLDDAELEIVWNNGETSELSGPRSVKVADLLKSVKVQTGLLDRVKKKVGILLTDNENANVRGVAGVRRSEVNIEDKDTLYWQPLNEVNFNDGYTAFKDNNFEKAITIFEDVIKQNPLNRQAEISRACLVTIYTEQKNTEKAKEHYNAFVKDFPNSELLPALQETMK
ncbi:MAG TPA: tetratricopeptide repeat protein [Melioribacteraceae bacterium]|nr:tetratricopeptide repeat protein [Melioribacteraceae bacterium]